MNPSTTRSEYLAVNANNQLLLDGVNLASLAEKHGTPLFVLSERILKDNAARFIKAMKKQYPRTSVFYSVKTNYTPRIVQTFIRSHIGAEVVSHFELHLASTVLGIPGEKIILNGPGKSVDELKLAIQRDIKTVNVDSYQDAETLERLVKKPRNFGVRFRPTVTKYKKFGIPEASNEMSKLLKLAKKSKHLQLRGVHFHAGPRMTERKPSRQNVLEATNLVRGLIDEGFEIKYLDVGAGFEPRLCGRTASHVRNLEEYAAIVGGVVRKFAKRSRTPKLELICEPGTALVESSALLLTKVRHLKPREGYKIAIVDGGLAILHEARSDEPPIHPENDIAIVNRAKSAHKEEIMLGGPLCLSYDSYPKASISEVRAGDLVAIFDVGAYAQSMSQQFIVPRPKAVMITESGPVEMVYRAETFEDMLSLYKV